MPPVRSTIVIAAAVGCGGIIALGASLDLDRAPRTVGAMCPPNVGPDVIVSDLEVVTRWGTIGPVSSYSFSTTSCNVGDERLDWVGDTSAHPVIAQNLYRLHDGRFEQIGASWLKHGYIALALSVCCECELASGSHEFLGVGCSDPYGATINGDQAGFNGVSGLGPRSEVNASTGDFPFPYSFQGMAGDVLYKRLQVRNDDLDPALNVGALYFGEGHYVTADDALAGNDDNNASFRPATVDPGPGPAWRWRFADVIRPMEPAIHAWAEFQAGVTLTTIDVPGDGRFIVGSACTDNGDGTWHYEYAVQNLNSHRSGRGFSVPVPAGTTVSNPGFHDVDSHSGEITDSTDWPPTIGATTVHWETDPFAVNEHANALRFSTLYNFRFDADRPPADGVLVTLELFRPGAPASVTAAVCGPAPVCAADITGPGGAPDGNVDALDYLLLIGQWGSPCGGPCDADITGPGDAPDGNVDALDFLLVIGQWGSPGCPSP
jgi:hypothetical protein